MRHKYQLKEVFTNASSDVISIAQNYNDVQHFLSGPPSMGSSSLDALRAHAAQAAANMQQQQQSTSVNMHPPSSPMNPPPKVVPDEVIKVEPDPEPIPEEDSQSSPVGPPRGPSPEPRIEDTECHRSQSAM